jgi:hypothetical protein
MYTEPAAVAEQAALRVNRALDASGGAISNEVVEAAFTFAKASPAGWRAAITAWRGEADLLDDLVRAMLDREALVQEHTP